MTEFRTLFTEQEWQTLQFGPMWITTAVGGSDGKVDEKEAEALQKELLDAPIYKSAFVREVFVSVVADVAGCMARYGPDPRNVIQGMQDIATLVDAKVDAAEAKAFKVALFGIGMNVAQASGGSMFHKDKISDEERRALAVAATALRLDLSSVFAA